MHTHTLTSLCELLSSTVCLSPLYSSVYVCLCRSVSGCVNSSRFVRVYKSLSVCVWRSCGVCQYTSLSVCIYRSLSMCVHRFCCMCL